MPVESMVKVHIRSGIREHDACLAYVRNRLDELEKDIKQSQANLHYRTNRLSDCSSIIRQAIETFIEENLISLRKKIEHKIQLLYHYYDERILELLYLQCNPTEAQIRQQECLIYTFLHLYTYEGTYSGVQAV